MADEDTFEEDFLNYRIGDVEFFFEDSLTNTVQPADDGQTDPDPVFGQRNLFATDPASRRSSRSRTSAGTACARTSTRSSTACIAARSGGVELDQRTIGPHIDDNVFADVWDVDPMLGAAYIQDRLDYGDLVIDLGLQWDHWDPNTVFPALPGWSTARSRRSSDAVS